MPRRPKFQIKNTPKGWRINVPKTVSATGKREQHFYATRDGAKEARAALLEKFLANGSAASQIRPQLAEDALAASQILKPWGVTLKQVATLYAREQNRKTASRPTDAACKEWLEIKSAEVRPKTLEGYRAAANRLSSAFGERDLSGLKTADLQKILAPPGTSPPTARANKVAARVFWLWAAEQGWCEADTIQKVKVPKAPEQGEIEILTPSEAARLLEAAEKFYPQAVPMFAVQLFAGIRAEEATKLRPENFTEAGIELSAAVTKKGRRRNIDPSPTLRAWLEKYPFKRCPNWPRVSRAVRHLAGFETWVEEGFIPEGIEPLSSPPQPWPQNALRHSFASFAVAAGTPLETLLWEFGHVGGTAMLQGHYVGRASKREALAFFSLRPGGKREPSKPAIVKSA